MQVVIHYASFSFYNGLFSLQKMLLAWAGQISVKPTSKGTELGRFFGWCVSYLLCLNHLFRYCNIYVLINLKPPFSWSTCINSGLSLGLKVTYTVTSEPKNKQTKKTQPINQSKKTPQIIFFITFYLLHQITDVWAYFFLETISFLTLYCRYLVVQYYFQEFFFHK